MMRKLTDKEQADKEWREKRIHIAMQAFRVKLHSIKIKINPPKLLKAKGPKIK